MHLLHKTLFASLMQSVLLTVHDVYCHSRTAGSYHYYSNTFTLPSTTPYLYKNILQSVSVVFIFPIILLNRSFQVLNANGELSNYSQKIPFLCGEQYLIRCAFTASSFNALLKIPCRHRWFYSCSWRKYGAGKVSLCIYYNVAKKKMSFVLCSSLHWTNYRFHRY